MYTRVLGLTTAALILTYGTMGADAQPRMPPPPPMGPEGAGPPPPPPPPVMRVMFALVDTDGDGAVSLQELQAGNERVFKAMDANKDGKLTPDEIKDYMHGGR